MTEEIQLKIRNFFLTYPVLKLSAKKDIILAGNQPKFVYFLDSGHVRQYDINQKNGLEFTNHIFDPGSFFPLTWAIADIRNQFFYDTLTPSRLFMAPKNDVVKFLKSNPEVLFSVTQRMLLGLENMSIKNKYYLFGDAHQKVASELLYLAKHFATVNKNKIIIAQHFTHQNIADLTGMARETISHILEEFRAKKILSYNKQSIVILNLAKLKKIAKL